MRLSRARIKRLEESLTKEVYLSFADWVAACLTPEKPLPSNYKLHPRLEEVVAKVLSHGYLRSALEVHQATPEDLAALGLEGREERDLKIEEMAALLNHKLGRPLDAIFDGEELKAIGRERYEPAEPEEEGRGDRNAPFYFQQPYKPGFPRSIFRQDCTATN